MGPTSERFWEIDFLRGLAVVLMIGFHWIEDQVLLLGAQVQLDSRLLDLWQKVTAGLFLTLVGVSLALSRMKINQSGFQLFRKNAQRGAVILFWGVLITLATRIYPNEGYVVFGILHLIGLSVILSYPFLKLRYWNLVGGILILGIGSWLNRLEFPFVTLVWAGFLPENFYSVDYFPLIPWFGPVLIGIYIGNVMYSDYSRSFPIQDFGRSPIIRTFRFLGKHSLLIYLMHQPLLIGLLTLFRFFKWI